MNYIDLHVHTDHTRGNSTLRIPDLVKRASQFGMHSLAITDSASTSGFAEFAQVCKEFDIKPIYGAGFYYAPDGISANPEDKYHVVLLAEDDFGLANILRLTAISYQEGFISLPRIDYAQLRDHSRGIICLTGGRGGVVDKMIINGDRISANRQMKNLHNIFDTDHLYLEIQEYGDEVGTVLKNDHKKYLKKHGIKEVVTGGSFYLNVEDKAACNRLRTKNGNRNLSDSKEYFFRSPEEIAEEFELFPEAIEITAKIAERCSISIDFTMLNHSETEQRERLYEQFRFCDIQ